MNEKDQLYGMKRIMCEDQRVKQLITVVQLRENVHAQLLIN